MIKVTAETITAAVTVKAIFFAFVFPENTASRILPQIRHTSHAIGNRITDISALMDASDRINIATEASNSNAAAAGKGQAKQERCDAQTGFFGFFHKINPPDWIFWSGSPRW